MSYHVLKHTFENIKKGHSQIKLSEDKALIRSDSINVTENITIFRNDFTIYKDSIVNYTPIFSGIVINICFNANHFYLSETSNFKINPIPNHTIINFITKDKGQIFYKSNSEIKNIIIHIKLVFLYEFFKENKEIKNFILNIEEQNFSRLIKVKKTDTKTKICASQIYKSLCANAHDILFIQSKVLEILSYEFVDLFEQTSFNDERIKFSSYDIKALYKAKEIIINNLMESPSIVELSKMVRLNSFKLKYGFKNFFKTTPRSFLIENRMIKAKKLLEESELNISEIANEVGYKQSHNLTSSFLKYYGVTPKDIIKNRNSYF